MPGIGGIYRQDGAEAGREAVAAMAASLHHRGPISFPWREGPVGLFCRYRGDSGDTFFRNGRVTVTADCRLDNRDELRRGFGLPRSTGDAELIAAAYVRWGKGCPEKLRGDFAFALWDRTLRTLLCARDIFGVKPFYYHHSSNFLFGSEIKAVLSIGQVAMDLDEERVADYLAGAFTSEEYTFYKHVRRLPSGHAMLVNRDGIRSWRFAAIAPATVRDREYVDAFRERFTESVKARVRGEKDVAVTLSGGIDSSSIAAVASRSSTRLHTFSAVFPERPECDERRLIDQTVSCIRCIPHFIDGELHDDGELWSVLQQMDEPFAAPNAYLPWRLSRAVSEAGIGVVLDGHGGDEVVSQGTGVLKDLAADGRWFKLASELRRITDAYERKFWPVMTGYMAYGLRRSDLRVLRRTGRILARLRPVSNTAVGIVSEGLAARTDLEDRLRLRKQDGSTESERHRLLVDRPERAYAFEVLDRIAGAFSVEPRYPFWDPELVGICLGMPPEWKLRDGHGRYVLRRAVQGMLPKAVCWRRTKTNFLPNLIQGLRGDESKALTSALHNAEILHEYVDMSALAESCRRAASGNAHLVEITNILHVALLGSWLRARESGEDSLHGSHRTCIA